MGNTPSGDGPHLLRLTGAAPAYAEVEREQRYRAVAAVVNGDVTIAEVAAGSAPSGTWRTWLRVTPSEAAAFQRCRSS
jgi:hypothetical protein